MSWQPIKKIVGSEFDAVIGGAHDMGKGYIGCLPFVGSLDGAGGNQN
jgi:hypothetical protein